MLWGLVKKALINLLIDQARKELSSLESAAQATHAYATDQEFKSEGKYDTRAIEASYLAEAEAKRVEELKLEIQILEEVDLDSSQKYGEVSSGALVELDFNNILKNFFWIPTREGKACQKMVGKFILDSVFSQIEVVMQAFKPVGK